MAESKKNKAFKDWLIVSRRPTHPGEMLREEFLPEFSLSVAAFAERLAVSRQTANELVHERRSVTPEMALRLARLFSTSPQYWMNMQRNVDLWNSLDLRYEEIEKVQPFDVPAMDAAAVG